jgi:hypothetical protein
LGLVLIAGPLAKNTTTPYETGEGEVVLTLLTKEEAAATATPDLVFSMRGPFGGNRWPILSWTPEIVSGHFVPADAGEATITASWVDRNGNVIVVASNPAASPAAKGSAGTATEDAGQDQDADGAPGDVAVEGAGAAGEADGQAAESPEGGATPATTGRVLRVKKPEFASMDSQKKLIKRNQLGYLPNTKMALTTLGCPLVTAGSVISVKGCGDFLDGNYEIITITHNWQNGVWETTLNGHMNTVEGTAGAKADPAPDE